ncbi:MAG: ankyrin repeat domain-containing protein [Gammaproteobacteria bacterium]|nr:ankyrin repeat domain-containing protein [Gammaproteobacteria bacterium]
MLKARRLPARPPFTGQSFDPVGADAVIDRGFLSSLFYIAPCKPPPERHATAKADKRRLETMEAMLAALLAVTVAVGIGLELSERKKRRKVRRDSRSAEFKAVVARLAHIEEVLELKERSTPLHFVYDPDVMRLLLASSGTDIDARDENGWTALHRASARGLESQSQVVRLLLKRGANPHVNDRRGKTPLHVAGSWGNAISVRSLLEAGSDPNAQDDDGKTALHHAMEFGNGDVARQLLDGQADVNAKDAEGGTPLYRALAARPGVLDSSPTPPNVAAVRLLFRAGADPDARDERGRTALHRAANFENGHAIRLLLEGGAEVDARDEDGASPLQHAAAAILPRDTEAMMLLLEADANPDARNRDGETPLHSAAERGHVDGVSLLLARGAAIDAADRWGATPLHRAAAQVGQNTAATVKMLVEAGANPDARSDSGHTPKDVATPEAAAVIADINN